MKFRFIAGLVLGTAGVSPAFGQLTQVQTFPFSFSNSGDITGTYEVVPLGGFEAMAQPFNAALPPLVSFEISWDIDFAGSGFATVSGASLSGSASGGYLVNGIGYSGNGGGNGFTAPFEAETFSFNFNVSGSTSFNTADAGVSYDSGILSAVLGASPFPLLWETSYDLSANNIFPNSGTANGSVTLRYNYLPEASTNVAMGLAFAAVGGLVWHRRRHGTAAEVAQAATK
jgi:hypothetical protein